MSRLPSILQNDAVTAQRRYTPKVYRFKSRPGSDQVRSFDPVLIGKLKIGQVNEKNNRKSAEFRGTHSAAWFDRVLILDRVQPELDLLGMPPIPPARCP